MEGIRGERNAGSKRGPVLRGILLGAETVATDSQQGFETDSPASAACRV